MRKGIDGLAAIVLGQFQRGPNCRDIFVFVGRQPSRLKALCWERDGFWLCAKRLANYTWDHVTLQPFDRGMLDNPASKSGDNSDFYPQGDMLYVQ
jgi:hypothetical protein